LKSSSMLSTRQLYRSNNQPASYAALTQFAPEPSGYLLRNGAAMGIEVRAVVRPRASPSTPAANLSMASR
jgi:hypothetical protein